MLRAEIPLAILLFFVTVSSLWAGDSSESIRKLLQQYRQRNKTAATNSTVNPSSNRDNEIEALINVSAIEEVAELFKEHFVVTGTKQKRRSVDSPFTVYVLDRKRIEALAANDVTELLAAVPGLDLFRINDRVTSVGPPSFATEIANQHLVLIDGVRFPTIRGGGADFWLLPVQVDEVERIEYLPGPLTSLYGACAAVGVINIITRRVSPETWPASAPSSFRLRVGGDGLEQYESTYHQQEGKTTLTAWGSFRSSDGYDQPVDSRTYQPAASFFSQDDTISRKMGVSIRQFLTSEKFLRYDFSYFRGKRSPIMPTLADAPEESEQKIYSIITYEDSPNADDIFTLSLKCINQNSDFSDYTNPIFDTPGTGDEYENRRLELRRHLKNRFGHRFTFSGDYERISAGGTNFGITEKNIYENSLSMLYELPLKKKHTLFLGLNRYDSSTMGDHLTWNLLLRKELSKGEVIRAGYGTSVRGPDLVGLYFTQINVEEPNPSGPPPTLTRQLLAGNPNLDVEEFDFAEVAYQKHWSKSSLQSRAYYGQTKGIMSLRATGEPAIDLTSVGGPILEPLEFFSETNNNTLFGLTTSWDYKFNSKWMMLTSWRYLHSKKDDGSKVRYSPRNHINLTLTYRADKRTSLNLSSRTYSSYITSENALSAGGEIDGYTVVDLAFKKKLGRKGRKSLWLKILNATDRKVIEAYPSTAFPPTESPAWFIERRAVFGYSVNF